MKNITSNNTKWTEKNALKLAADMIDWLKADDSHLFIEEFIYMQADKDNYDGRRIYPNLMAYLCKKYVMFAIEYDLVKAISEVKLKSMSIQKKCSENIAKFVLSAKYNYSEKSEKTVIVNNVPIMTVDPLADNGIPETPKKRKYTKRAKK